MTDPSPPSSTKPPANLSATKTADVQHSPMFGLWFCLGLGVLILLMFPRSLQFAGHALFGTHVEPITLDGVEVPYHQSDFFWPDLGPTTLGLMLIVEGITFLLPRRGVLLAALLFTVACTGFNLIYTAASFSRGLAVISAIAVLVGVPMAVDLFKRLRAAASRGMSP